MEQNLLYKIKGFIFETVDEKDSEFLHMSDFLDEYMAQPMKERITDFNIFQVTALHHLGSEVHLKVRIILLAETPTISHSS